MVRGYRRALEAEVARLRAENRALLNSILGIAGIPPITVETADAADIYERRGEPASSGAGSGSDSAGVERVRSGRNANAARALGATFGPPLRRRTWLQLNRGLEIDAARKKAAEASAGPELGAAAKNA